MELLQVTFRQQRKCNHFSSMSFSKRKKTYPPSAKKRHRKTCSHISLSAAWSPMTYHFERKFIPRLLRNKVCGAMCSSHKTLLITRLILSMYIICFLANWSEFQGRQGINKVLMDQLHVTYVKPRV